MGGSNNAWQKFGLRPINKNNNNNDYDDVDEDVDDDDDDIIINKMMTSYLFQQINQSIFVFIRWNAMYHNWHRRNNTIKNNLKIKTH